jgi:hypothetical protein
MKTARGGKRPNAGRPKGPPTCQVTARVPIEYAQDVRKAIADKVAELDGKKYLINIID